MSSDRTSEKPAIRCARATVLPTLVPPMTTPPPRPLAGTGLRPRIASLVPSLTETLVALGLGPWLVARTGYCVHPATALRAVPKVGGTKDVNLDKLRRLAPTHVVLNVDENRLDTAQALQGFVPQVIVTHPCAPADVDALLQQLAAAFEGLVDAPVASRARRLRALLARQLTRPAEWPARRVVYLVWRDPWMTVARDTYIAQLLGHAGCRTWPEVDGGPHGAARYPVLRGDEPWLRQVDELWLSSEPYAFGEADVDAAQALAPQARVRLVDGERLSWYGARTVSGLRYARRLARG